jgi:nucleosome-remodeling factor subunit BPTF
MEIENHEVSEADGGSSGVDGGDSSLQALLSSPTKQQTNKAATAIISVSTKEMMSTIRKRIQQVRTQYADVMKLCKNMGCYSCNCNAMNNKNNVQANKAQSLVYICYSPLCMQKVRLKRELITLCRKANTLNNNQLLSQPSQITTKSGDEVKDAIKLELESAIHGNEEASTINITKNTAVSSPPPKKLKLENNLDNVTTTITTSNITTTTTTTTMVTTTQRTVKNTHVMQGHSTVNHNSVTVSSSDSTTTTTNKNGAKTVIIVNRRGRTVQRSTVSKELNADGSERIYTTTSTEGKVYLKKVAISLADRRKKRTPVKYPLCSTFCTRNKHRSILLLPQHELRKLSRVGGKMSVQGFHHQAKANLSVWLYPCSRPLFKTCWLYRTVGLKSLAAAAIQLRILWACLRWDDMAAKPMSTDGKNQITTDTEIMSLEILKHRHVGQFLDRTQYLRRKVVIPLELPKQVRGAYTEII